MPNAVPALSAVILLLTIALVALIWWQLSGPVYRAVDGDTIEDKAGASYRIAGIDTPELRSKDQGERLLAIKAKDRLAQILSSGGIKIHPVMAKNRAGELVPKPEKYGRRLVTITAGGKDVGEMLVVEGLARRYSGGKRQPWTAGDAKN